MEEGVCLKSQKGESPRFSPRHWGKGTAEQWRVGELLVFIAAEQRGLGQASRGNQFLIALGWEGNKALLWVALLFRG